MSRQPWDQWYTHSAWRRRRRLQLLREPFCCYCLAQGRNVVASVVDHVTPHRGDRTLFKLGPLQSLCEGCHNSTKQQVERNGFCRDTGVDGMPVDKRHPCYTGTTRKSETAPSPAPDLTKLIS